MPDPPTGESGTDGDTESDTEAECLRADPDLRRRPLQGPDLGFPGWRALAPDGRLRVPCGLAADWSEPEGIRWALTELGARTPVVPPLTACLRATAADNAPGWPSARFTEIINDLADHAQVILYSQFWHVDAGRTYGVSDTGLDWDLDWTAPWEHLAEESRTWSLLEASEAPVGDDIFVAPTWIDRTDLHPER